jgi:hypothetical protein
MITLPSAPPDRMALRNALDRDKTGPSCAVNAIRAPDWSTTSITPSAYPTASSSSSPIWVSVAAVTNDSARVGKVWAMSSATGSISQRARGLATTSQPSTMVILALGHGSGSFTDDRRVWVRKSHNRNEPSMPTVTIMVPPFSVTGSMSTTPLGCVPTIRPGRWRASDTQRGDHPASTGKRENDSARSVAPISNAAKARYEARSPGLRSASNQLAR